MRDVLYSVFMGGCKWEENSNFASDMYGAHVILVHDNVIERCGEKYANR